MTAVLNLLWNKMYWQDMSNLNRLNKMTALQLLKRLYQQGKLNKVDLGFKASN
jgi:hypothetical protein